MAAENDDAWLECNHGFKLALLGGLGPGGRFGVELQVGFGRFTAVATPLAGGTIVPGTGLYAGLDLSARISLVRRFDVQVGVMPLFKLGLGPGIDFTVAPMIRLDSREQHSLSLWVAIPFENVSEYGRFNTPTISYAYTFP